MKTGLAPSRDYAEWVRLPQGYEYIEVLDIVDPDTIFVYLDDIMVRQVPVSVENISIVPEQGYFQVGPVSFHTDSVRILGPQSKIKDMHFVYTEEKEYSGKKKDFSDRVKLQKIYQSLVEYEVSEVEFNADVQKLGEVEIRNVPVTMEAQPRRYSVRIDPDVVTLHVSGGVDYISLLTPEDFKATISFNRQWRRLMDYRTPVTIEMPENVVAVKTTPEMFTVNIN